MTDSEPPFETINKLLSSSDSEKLDRFLKQLSTDIRQNPGKPPISALEATKQAGHKPADRISTSELARYWIEANHELVFFVVLGRLALPPGKVLRHGDWEVEGLGELERRKYLAPFLAAIGMPLDAELQELQDSESILVMNLMLALTHSAIQNAIEDFIFRLFNKGCGIGFLTAIDKALNNDKQVLLDVVSTFPESPLSLPRLGRVLNEALTSRAFFKKYRKGFAQSPDKRTNKYRAILAFLCFNRDLVRLHFKGQLTAQALVEIIEKNGLTA